MNGCTPELADNTWTAVTLDLSPHLSNKLQIRFGYANVQGQVFAVSNWNVDDVRLVKKACN